MKIPGVLRKGPAKRLFARLSISALLLGGCAAAKSYKAPVAKFETGVNQAASTVEPYFTQLNRMENQYQLFEKVYEKKDWGTEDLSPRFSAETIRLRVQALDVIKRYAKLLSEVAGSSSPQDYQQAANELGKQTRDLADTAAKIRGANTPAIGDCLGNLVNFLGQIAIEHERKKALAAAIKAGEEPVKQLIHLLRDDTVTAGALSFEAAKQRQVILLKLYNEERKHATSPEALEELMKKVLDDNQSLQGLFTLPVNALFDEMESASDALVKFANSRAKSGGVAGLTAQIEVFSEQAQMLSDLVQSFQKKGER